MGTENFLSLIRSICSKNRKQKLSPTLYLTVKDNVLTLKFLARQGYPPSPLLYNRVLEVPARAVRQETGRKTIQIKKESRKNFVFEDDMVIHVDNPTKH